MCHGVGLGLCSVCISLLFDVTIRTLHCVGAVLMFSYDDYYAFVGPLSLLSFVGW